MRQHAVRRFLRTGFLMAFFTVLTYHLVQYKGTGYLTGDGSWDSLQRDRLQRIKDTCAGFKKPNIPHMLKDKRLLTRLLYNDKHQIIYCNIPKIASTNWKRIFTILNGRVNTTEPLNITHEFVHQDRVTFSMSLWNLSHSDRLIRLNTYKKFVFVRHPFERLLSAYKDKLRGNSTNSIKNFQKVYGTRILRRYRPDASEEVIARGGDVTFPEFVRYLTDTKLRYRLANYHWNPMSQLCKPCQVNYNYVGKYETLLSDVSMILRHSNIVLPFTFPPRDNLNSNTGNELYSYMKQLTEEQIQHLYEAYRNDFELFGYDYTDWGQQS